MRANNSGACFLAVWGRCKKFPDLNAQKHPSHELLSEVQNDARLPASIKAESVEVLVPEGGHVK